MSMQFIMVRIALLLCALMIDPSAGEVFANSEHWTLVQGRGCVKDTKKGNDEEARKRVLALAKNQAIRTTTVWEEIGPSLESTRLKNEILDHFSRAKLRFIKIGKIERDGPRLCLSIQGKIDLIEMREEIQKRQKQEKVIQVTDSTLSNPKSAFELEVGVTKESGHYVEGELVQITVKAAKDSYLKLDYYQNDGKVIHLIPNLFQEKAFIKRGDRYEFGGEKSNYEFKVVKPFGPERIVATASTEPFDEIFNRPNHKEDGLIYAEHRIRGLIVQAKKPKAEVAVAMVKVYTEAREPVLPEGDAELRM